MLVKIQFKFFRLFFVLFLSILLNEMNGLAQASTDTQIPSLSEKSCLAHYNSDARELSISGKLLVTVEGLATGTFITGVVLVAGAELASSFFPPLLAASLGTIVVAGIPLGIIIRKDLIDERIQKTLLQAYRRSGGNKKRPHLTNDDLNFYNYYIKNNVYLKPDETDRLTELKEKMVILKEHEAFNKMYKDMKIGERLSKDEFANKLVALDAEGSLCKKVSSKRQKILGFHFKRRSVIKQLVLSK